MSSPVIKKEKIKKSADDKKVYYKGFLENIYSDRDFHKILKNIDFIPKRDYIYNIDSLAEILGIKTTKDIDNLCRHINSVFKNLTKKDTELKEILKELPRDNSNFCEVIINALYEYIFVYKKEFKLPISMTEEKYTELISKNKRGTIQPNEKKLLDNIMNIKLCNCIKGLIISDIIDEKNNIKTNRKSPKYNAYAVCLNSIYKQRNMPVPYGATKQCKYM